MTIPEHGWTTPRRTATQRADPSGVQAAGTDVQAWLLSGMATVTERVRYISLFTATRRLRQQSRSAPEEAKKVSELTRRLEALVAASSVLHHEPGAAAPGGIVGANSARGLIGAHHVALRLPIRQPAYNIFRGTLDALGLFDLTKDSDPLFEAAIPLGDAWDVEAAGTIGKYLHAGELPATLPRNEVEAACAAFCLCRVPDGSAEQRELIRLLFALDRDVPAPEFREGPTTPALRSASWGFTLELVALSPGRELSDAALMNRLLEPDIVGAMPLQSLHQCLLVWRWVAARAFFERGWTIVFNSALNRLKGEREGLERREFLDACARRYLDGQVDEPVAQLVAEVNEHLRDPGWLRSLHVRRGRRDALLLVIAGVECARSDEARPSVPVLASLYTGRGIPFGPEGARIQRLVSEGRTASDYWAELSEDTLVQHVHIALRKMSAGNPDSLHVDFDAARWCMPTKTLSWPAPQLAGGGSRLDVAISWGVQLGLVEAQDAGAYALTPLGEQTRQAWRKQRRHWP